MHMDFKHVRFKMTIIKLTVWLKVCRSHGHSTIYAVSWVNQYNVDIFLTSCLITTHFSPHFSPNLAPLFVLLTFLYFSFPLLCFLAHFSSLPNYNIMYFAVSVVFKLEVRSLNLVKSC